MVMRETMLLLIEKNFLRLWKGKYFIFLLYLIFYLFILLTFFLHYSYQKLMPKFIGDELEIRIDPELESGQKQHILVTHDETTFQSNDGQKSGWRPKNEQPLRKKGQGRSIHVSDFLIETIGRLKLNENNVDETIPHEARVTINPGKNFDGWWNVDHLIHQVI